MNKHTPGPWKFGWESFDREWAIVTTISGSIIANVTTETGPDAISKPAPRKMPAEANARLIAAAPNMLDALREFVGAVDAGTHFADLSVLQNARTAIALAEGRA